MCLYTDRFTIPCGILGGVTSDMTPGAQRVLDAAGRLFYEQGIHATGMEAIADAAQVTKKTIYDRFGSKDALIEAYLRARSERWRAWLLASLEQAPPDPVERLLATFDALGSWLRREKRRGCGFVNARAELTDHHHPGRRVAEAEKAWLLELLTTLARSAPVSAPDELARELFMLHEGAVVAFTMVGDDGATDAARDAAAALIERGPRE
jgi:AcrR family transcriptional regulator